MAATPSSGPASLAGMPAEHCPVCKAEVPPSDSRSLECPGCGAELELDDHGAWVLAGEAPAG